MREGGREGGRSGSQMCNIYIGSYKHVRLYSG